MKNTFISIALLVALTLGTQARAELFQDGETVCFLGDSITARGSLQTNVSNFYLTRFPDRTVAFVNAGRSGDSANGSLRRIEEDVIDQDPTSVVILFGMNDVGRGSYTFNPTEAQIESQNLALERFRASMEETVARIRTEADDPKLLFMTPTPYDQTAEMKMENQSCLQRRHPAAQAGPASGSTQRQTEKFRGGGCQLIEHPASWWGKYGVPPSGGGEHSAARTVAA